MGNEWIIGVLADLREFSKTNGLPMLAAKLEDAAKVASAELSETLGDATVSSQGYAETGSLFTRSRQGTNT